MTKFSVTVIFVSAMIAALGWLADGGSVDKNAASFVDRLKSSEV